MVFLVVDQRIKLNDKYDSVNSIDKAIIQNIICPEYDFDNEAILTKGIPECVNSCRTTRIATESAAWNTYISTVGAAAIGGASGGMAGGPVGAAIGTAVTVVVLHHVAYVIYAHAITMSSDVYRACILTC